MPKSTTWVVKLGGAMMRAPELPAWLAACADPWPLRVVVVVGGGARADEVRKLQQRERFNDAHAHRLAIEAMYSNAESVAASHAGLEFRCRRDLVIGGGLWDPREALEWREVPRNWSVTSDSLALYLARRIEANAVVLVKSVDRGRIERFCTGYPDGETLVDAHLPGLVASADIPLAIESKYELGTFRAALERAVPPGVPYPDPARSNSEGFEGPEETLQN